jgi:hypothetical protein
MASIVTRAGVDLNPNAAWLLVQIERERDVDVHRLGRRGKWEAKSVRAATAELLNKSLIEAGSVANVYRLTDAGCEIQPAGRGASRTPRGVLARVVAEEERRSG